VLGRHEWARHKLQIPQAEYDNYARQFNPARFQADAWVDLAASAGAKYIVITSKHHDGFSIYRSSVRDYDMEMTPYPGDPLKMLAESARRKGLRLGFYHSIMDWHHPDYRPLRAWEHPANYASGGNLPRYIEFMKAQLRELLTNYGDVAMIWFDGEWEHRPEEIGASAIQDLIRGLQPNTLINDRLFNRRPGSGDFGTPEQFVPSTGLTSTDGKPLLWESCVTINTDSWGYNKYETEFKTARDLIRMLVEVVSKGGNLLLNVGPRPDGTIQPEFVERLQAIGRWMEVNHESIYETTASPFARLPFYGRATVKGSTLYLHIFEWPSGGRLRVPGLKNIVHRARLLANPAAPVTTVRDGDDLLITLPAQAPDAIASVVALQLDGAPAVTPYADAPGENGVITLSAASGEIESRFEQRVKTENLLGHVYFTHWTRPDDTPAWRVYIPKDQRYSIELRYGAGSRSAGLPFAVWAGDTYVTGQTESTGDSQVFKTFVAGTLSLKAGTQRIAVKSGAPPGASAMNLEAVILRPVK
jgi:alpha-L-fucosidase